MLTCKLNKDKTLKIQFDLPVPSSCFDNVELKKITDSVSSGNDSELEFTLDKQLSRMTISLNTLYLIIDKQLPLKQAQAEKNMLQAMFTNQSSFNKEGLEVNFHQNPFDTPERYWNFILSQGHFISYFCNRINWFLGPKNEYVTPFPLHVDLESASTCNMNCPMCYRDELKHTGHMDVDLFKKTIDECADNNLFSVRLSWRGETLTHPEIKQMIAYATSKIKNVSFLTNAFYLDEDMIDCFIESKLSYLAVSFDGIKDVYEKIRAPAKFQENYKRLKLLKKKKQEAKSVLPQVRLCTIWPAIRENSDDYYNTMKEVCDYMVCNPYINFKGPMKVKPDFICQYPWERIVVGYNGDAQCCTGWNADDIILGNTKEHSLYDMWHSNKMKEIRNIHSKGQRMQLNSCANCRHGSKGDDKITIDEIIGRKY